MPWSRRDLFALLGCVLCWLLYIAGGAQTYQPADSAEFLTVAARAGVAHPPGYPLYTLLGVLAVRVLPLSVPSALAVLAATLTLGTLLGIYVALRILTGSRAGALFGALFAGTSLHIWKHATHPEAFALLGFFAAWQVVLVAMALAPGASVTARTRAWYGYALCVGLSTSHHHTIVLTAPLGVVLLVALFFSSNPVEARLRTFIRGVGLFFLGLTPYLAIYFNTHPPLGSWGEFQTFSDVLHHFLRTEYGTFQSGIYNANRSTWHHSWLYLQKALSLRGSFPAGLSAFWVAGIGLLLLHLLHVRVATARTSRPLAGALLLSWLIAGVLFPTQLKMGTTPLDQYIVARFFLLPDLFLSIFAGYTAATLLSQPWSVRLRRLLLAGLAVLLLSCAFLQAPRGSSRHRRWLQQYGEDLLRELPRGALLLEAQDEATCFGVTYLQQVVGLRRDVRFVCVPHLARRWYVRQLGRLWPEFSYRWNPKRISTLSLIAHYQRLKRPVHVTTLYNASIQRWTVWIPHGLSWKALRRGQAPPPPRQVAEELRKRFAKLSAPLPRPNPQEDPWPAFLAQRYTFGWLALAHAFRRAKQLQQAARCMKIVRRWQPPPGTVP